MRCMARIMLLSWILAALTGCTLSFDGPQVATRPEFSGVPVVRITAPLPNATYLSGVSVNVQVQVTAAGPDIDRVEVFVDEVLIGTLPQPNPLGAAAFGVTQTFTATGEGQHTVRALAYREDGTISDPAIVTINVLDQLPARATAILEPSANPPVASPVNTAAATVITGVTQAATIAPIAQSTVNIIINPTTISTAGLPPTRPPSAAAPIAKFEGVVNVRRGPSTNFEPPLGTFQAGQQAEILAQNNDGTWLKVKFATGEGWVFAQIAKTEGDMASLPREVGPPIPTARPATATSAAPVIQPTSAPGEPTAVASDGPNLVVVNWEMRVIGEDRPSNDIAVNKPSIAFVRVRNAGSQPASGFFAVLTIVNSGDSGAKIVEAGSSGGLAPGEEQLIQIGFTETIAPAGTGRVAVVRLDENNQVPETNENDNASSPISYTLAAN